MTHFEQGMSLETYMRHRGDNLRPPSGEMGGDMGFSPTSPQGKDVTGMTLATYMWTGGLTQEEGANADTSQIIFNAQKSKVGATSNPTSFPSAAISLLA
jgi:hypothetical protein